ncbi:MAG: DUF5996 family protein [Ktedonobacteraceae bacterium]
METWPELAYESWKETRETLHMWTQIVGKVKLELCPFLNQWWEITFHLTPRGLNTGLIPWQGESFDVDFDFIDHVLTVRLSDGRSSKVTLEPRSVADFYRIFMQALTALGIEVKFSTLPAEVPNGIRFEQDTVHASYDKGAVQRWWRIMLAVGRAMERFRTPFHGKSSPVQFFWGGFDLDLARFNGKPAPTPNYGGRIMAFGENEENFAIGFWPGTDQFPHPALYAYVTPAPAKIAEVQIQPEAAHFDTKMGEFILLYDDVRRAPSPEEAVLSFFQSTYEASVALAGWDRATLEGNVPDLKKTK